MGAASVMVLGLREGITDERRRHSAEMGIEVARHKEGPDGSLLENGCAIGPPIRHELVRVA